MTSAQEFLQSGESDALRSALLACDTSDTADFLALCKIIENELEKPPNNGAPLQSSTPARSAASVVIQALTQRRDIETIVRLAGASSHLNNSAPFVEHCLDAAVEFGDMEALHMLADDYVEPEVDSDIEARNAYARIGAGLIMRMAELGFEQVYFTAAELCHQGRGVTVNHDKAMDYYTKFLCWAVPKASFLARDIVQTYDAFEELYGVESSGELAAAHRVLWRFQSEVAQDFAKRISALFPGQEIEVLTQKGRLKQSSINRLTDGT